MFTTSDPLDRKITLKSSTYNDKIANISGDNDDKKHGNSHTDISVSDIKDTIETPTYIVKDIHTINRDGQETKEISETRQQYISIGVDDLGEKLKSTKVVVDFPDGVDCGEVVTAFRENKVSKISTKGGIVYDVHGKK